MKNTLRKFIVLLVGLAIGVGCSILSCIYGWGLEPKSWVVIIGLGIFGQLFGMAVGSLAVDRNDNN